MVRNKNAAKNKNTVALFGSSKRVVSLSFAVGDFEDLINIMLWEKFLWSRRSIEIRNYY